MIWLGLGVLLAAIFVVGNIRVWRRESIRLSCISMAIDARAFHGRVYSHAEKTEVIMARVYAFEDYVMKGQPKSSKPPVPPPPPPPPKRDLPKPVTPSPMVSS